MSVARVRMVPKPAAYWEPQGQDQRRLSLIFQPVFMAESVWGSPLHASGEGLTSTPPLCSEALLYHAVATSHCGRPAPGATPAPPVTLPSELLLFGRRMV